MIEKHCVARGCTRVACYGFGSPRRIEAMRWACARNVKMIWPGDAQSDRKPAEAGAVVLRCAAPASPIADHGSLFG